MSHPNYAVHGRNETRIRFPYRYTPCPPRTSVMETKCGGKSHPQKYQGHLAKALPTYRAAVGTIGPSLLPDGLHMRRDLTFFAGARITPHKVSRGRFAKEWTRHAPQHLGFR